jgi:hypothetical protein
MNIIHTHRAAWWRWPAAAVVAMALLALLGLTAEDDARAEAELAALAQVQGAIADAEARVRKELTSSIVGAYQAGLAEGEERALLACRRPAGSEGVRP